MFQFLIASAFVISAFTMQSCYKDKAAPSDCETTTVSYSQDIVPIINQSCKAPAGQTGCHENWIDDYSQVKGKIKSGVWQQRVLDLQDMPVTPNNFGIEPLTEEELRKMRCWIEQGFKKN